MNKERGILGEVVEVFRALRWYMEDPRKQYTNGEVKEYDLAARLLTDREGFAKFLADRIGSDSGKILEIASGTGLVSQELSERFQSNVVFNDKSAPAISLLKKRVGGSAKLVIADFLSLPFESSAFDVVVCVGGYRYIRNEDKELFWREMSATLKPRGRLFIGQFYPRGFSLRGSDINKDFNLDYAEDPNFPFSLKSVKTYQAKIKQPFEVTSGKYILFEFTSASVISNSRITEKAEKVLVT